MHTTISKIARMSIVDTLKYLLLADLSTPASLARGSDLVTWYWAGTRARPRAAASTRHTDTGNIRPSQ